MIPSSHSMQNIGTDSSVRLLVKAQSGDNDALNRLLTRYLPRLRRWASGRLPWALRSMLDTGDLVQDAILNTLPHLNGLEIRTERALQFYLQRAVQNHIIDQFKRTRRRPAREDELPDLPSPGVQPHEAAVEAEVLERYERGLASLKDKERQAIVMRVELALDYEEIAAQLGKPSANAARMTVTRALVRLADQMGHRRRISGADGE
jgi:RNA polymerase sigma-70 factor (ECF subfamily)